MKEPRLPCNQTEKIRKGKSQTPLSMIARVALLVALFMRTLPDEVRLFGFQEPNDQWSLVSPQWPVPVEPHCLKLLALTTVSLQFLIPKSNIGGMGGQPGLMV